MYTWIDSSTRILECYIYEVPHGTALVFHCIGSGQGYDACIIDSNFRCPDESFLVLDEAQAWAERELGSVLKERSVGA
jgi:hypothetical protein